MKNIFLILTLIIMPYSNAIDFSDSSDSTSETTSIPDDVMAYTFTGIFETITQEETIGISDIETTLTDDQGNEIEEVTSDDWGYFEYLNVPLEETTYHLHFVLPENSVNLYRGEILNSLGYPYNNIPIEIVAPGGQTFQTFSDENGSYRIHTDSEIPMLPGGIYTIHINMEEI